MSSNYVPVLRRRREGVTDYRARKRAITSQKPMLVVRISNKNVSAQFVKATMKGDFVLSAAHSRELIKLGWRGSPKSTPACYLLGLLAGKKAAKAGVKEAILYSGLSQFIKGARVAAVLKGVVESGIAVPVGEEAFPADDRLTGKSISEYAASLAKEDKEGYERAFSALVKGGFKPEEYPAEFEKAKAMVTGGRS